MNFSENSPNSFTPPAHSTRSKGKDLFYRLRDKKRKRETRVKERRENRDKSIEKLRRPFQLLFGQDLSPETPKPKLHPIAEAPQGGQMDGDAGGAEDPVDAQVIPDFHASEMGFIPKAYSGKLSEIGDD